MTDDSDASKSNDFFRSALHDEHVSLGVEVRDVGGHEVPFHYSSEIAKHNAVREAVDVFDLSLMDITRVTGEDAAVFLAHSLVSAIKPLALGCARRAMIVQEDSGIIDDLIIHRLGSHEFVLVRNATAAENMYSTLRERVSGYNVQVERMNDRNVLLATQGPKAAKLLRRLLSQDLHTTFDGMDYYSCTLLEVAGVEVIVARTGYTGEDGFEIFPPADRAAEVWHAIIAADGKVENPENPADNGADLGLLPYGLACRDTLRLEVGAPLYGYELTRDRTPLEAGLKSIMGSTRGQFIGRNALTNRPQSKELLVGLRFSGDEAPKRGTRLVDVEDNEVGVLTSAKMSPTLGHPIGFAYVQCWRSATDTELTVEGTDTTATVAPTPLYSRRRRR